jgi:hypothetical protein
LPEPARVVQGEAGLAASEPTLAEDGFTVFGGLLGDGAVAQLRATAACGQAGDDLYVCGRETLEQHPELVLPLICSPAVLDACEAVMGPFVQMDSFSVVGLRPGGGGGISWHRDVYGSVPRSSAFERPLALNLLVYLQDLTPDVGPLRVILGSHREPLLLTEAERREPHPREQLIGFSAGDAVLIHNNLVHSRSPNRSGTDRMHISVVYTLSCMRPSIDTSRDPLAALLVEARRVGDARLMRLLGDDVHAQARFNAGFLRADSEAWRDWIAADRGART